MPSIRDRASGVLDLLLPPACVSCRGPLGQGGGGSPVCRNCRLALPRIPLPRCPRCGTSLGTGRAPSCRECAEWPRLLARAEAACALAGPARALVHGFKYDGWKRVGDFMAGEIVERTSLVSFGADALLPIPTSSRNVRRRGYNQARVVAEALSRHLRVPVVDALARRRQTGTQTALKPLERRANVRDAFALLEARDQTVRDLRIAVVDDVITTGATIQAAVRTLESGAPAVVIAVAFARTIPFVR